MKFNRNILPSLLASLILAKKTVAFSPIVRSSRQTVFSSSSALKVSIGLGPEAEEEKAIVTADGAEEKKPLVEADHELFRDSRLSDLDKICDTWFASLLGPDDKPTFLGKVSEDAQSRVRTLHKLERNPVYTADDEEWTPYQHNVLLDSPVLPAYGLEQFGLPTPRRNAEAWRHFDVPGLVGIDYSCTPTDIGMDLTLDEAKTNKYIETLKIKGAWLGDDECAARLIYINGRFAPSLSKTSDIAKNIVSDDFTSGNVSEDDIEKMCRLTDGFTDRLAADVPSGETEFLTSLKNLSCPDHAVGEPTSQFSMNNQQGTACFVALNSVRAGSVAYIKLPNDVEVAKPMIVVNAVTSDGGIAESLGEKGVAVHPRAFVNAGANSQMSFIQTNVDLDEEDNEIFNQKFVNSCTQIYVDSGANVTHSYLEETGGMVTGGIETPTEEEKEGEESKRAIEAKRGALRDTHFESIDVHVIGEDGAYKGAALCVGGNGKSRVAISTSLLKPGAHATVNGFSLSGGAQRTDFRTNIHHIAQGTTSRQGQKNMIGGRATTSFRGRIRVDQSAQQTDSEQLARTILLSDKARIIAVPSLEIIADDVVCAHGATVSDLSEEELFYLRSRGLDRVTSRNMLMYGFVDDVGGCVDESMQGQKDGEYSLKNRIIKKLENVVPQGDRAIKGEYQSV